MTKKLRTLFFDIETSPSKAWIWRTGKQYINNDQIVDGTDPNIICICYKWSDEKTVHSLDWGYKAQDSLVLLEKFAAVVEQAELIIGQNSDKFDIKHINTQRLLHNQKPIAWPTSEDTLKQLRKHFYLPSYRLDYVAKALTGSGKKETSFKLWKDIVEKTDKKALAELIAYCKNDVVKLEQVWNRIAPFCSVKASVTVEKLSCPRCGHDKAKSRGHRVQATGLKYRMRACSSCGHVYKAERIN